MGKTALVVTGGGSKGAFAVGVIKYLFEKQPLIHFDIICGTSTGSLMAPLVATGEIKELEKIYTGLKTEDILLKGNLPDRFLHHNSLFDVSPLIAVIKRELAEERYNKIVASGKALFLATVSLQTGKIVYFSTKEMPAGEGYEVIKMSGREEMMRAIVASADQPVLMPPIEIRSSQATPRQYVDGGVREYAPIQVAIDDGATDVYAVVLSPKNSVEKNKEFTSLVDILQRTIDLFSEDVKMNDIEIPRSYSRGIKYLNRVKERVAQKTGLSKNEVDGLFALADNPYEGKKDLNLYIFRPDRPLPIETLEFDENKMKDMVAYGYQTAEQGPVYA